MSKKIIFGITPTAIYTSNTANMTGSTIRLRGKVYRTAAATQRAIVTMNQSGTAVTVGSAYTTPAETLSGTVVIRVTGQNSSDGTRVIQRMFEIKHCAAPV